MLETLLQFFILFLAAYGFISLITGITGVMRKRSGEGFRTRLALLVENQEESIEGVIRTVFMEHILGKVMSKENLMVVDMGSQDDTMDILLRLKEEYGCMDVLTVDEKDRIFNHNGSA